ncbi:hypothetical protein [Saccharothrix luteola]|uniref:hypothetical protein n=1 Tax=Saccharothrix luteola TaxID=2893018 RepID=UPI001E31875D|nr:hypothetical protein [Saccharothrix luteola]MCC8250598.1 hypothetical protein [Saccharothrix luteola]
MGADKADAVPGDTHNAVDGAVQGTSLQVGAVHGDVHLHAPPARVVPKPLFIAAVAFAVVLAVVGAVVLVPGLSGLFTAGGPGSGAAPGCGEGQAVEIDVPSDIGDRYDYRLTTRCAPPEGESYQLVVELVGDWERFESRKFLWRRDYHPAFVGQDPVVLSGYTSGWPVGSVHLLYVLSCTGEQTTEMDVLANEDNYLEEVPACAPASEPHRLTKVPER